MIECAECGAEFELEELLRLGDLLDCPECAAELEVVEDDPLRVESAVAEDEETEGAKSGDLEEDDWLP